MSWLPDRWSTKLLRIVDGNTHVSDLSIVVLATDVQIWHQKSGAVNDITTKKPSVDGRRIMYLLVDSRNIRCDSRPL